MRIGFIGPSRGDEEALREGVEFLLGDVGVDQAIYLGDDDLTIERVVTEWAREIFGDEPTEAIFLDRALELAVGDAIDEVDTLLGAEASLRRLSAVRKLPPPPARGVEMLADRVVLVVHDKAVLDEEDIANSHLIVYGVSDVAQLKRFGNRYFLTPGPAPGGQVAIVELEDESSVSIALFETSGVPVWRETMVRRTTKMNVSR